HGVGEALRRPELFVAEKFPSDNRPSFRVQSCVMKLRTAPVFVAAFAALITLLAQAQQPAAAPGAAPGKDKAKAKGGGAPKGINWPSPPLPSKFDTGVERNLTLTITKGLNTSFSMVFPDADTILVTNAAANSVSSAMASS